MNDPRLTITPAMNGFIVEHSWFEPKKQDDEFSSYRNDKSIMPTWNDVVEFIKANELKGSNS